VIKTLEPALSLTKLCCCPSHTAQLSSACGGAAAMRLIQAWHVHLLTQFADARALPCLQVALNVVTLAFLVVASTCAVLIPVMLYIFWLKPSGWQWYDAALFGSIIASTDAVAIVAVLKKSARPFPFQPPAAGARLTLQAAHMWTSFGSGC
jgi:hypothetical protein